MKRIISSIATIGTVVCSCNMTRLKCINSNRRGQSGLKSSRFNLRGGFFRVNHETSKQVSLQKKTLRILLPRGQEGRSFREHSFVMDM